VGLNSKTNQSYLECYWTKLSKLKPLDWMLFQEDVTPARVTKWRHTFWQCDVGKWWFRWQCDNAPSW